MEITSLPGPDRTITDEDIQNRRMISRRYRNRRIGDFLKELKLVEGRNTGIPTVLRSMEMNGSPLPIFETDAERTYFTVILPVHDAFLHIAEKEGKNPVKPNARRSVEEIKDLIVSILDRIGNLSTTELATKMDYAKATQNVRKAIKELVKEGKVAYSDPDHPRSSNQKIYLVKDNTEE